MLKPNQNNCNEGTFLTEKIKNNACKDFNTKKYHCCSGVSYSPTKRSKANGIKLSNKFQPLSHEKDTDSIDVIDQLYSKSSSKINNQSVNSNTKLFNRKSGKSARTKKQPMNHSGNGKKEDKLTLCFWNGQSIADKAQVITDFKTDNDIDIYLLVETWLSESNHSKVITELKGNTCNFINYPRPYSGRGGGIGCLFNKQISLHQTTLPFTFSSMQVLELSLNCACLYIQRNTLW